MDFGIGFNFGEQVIIDLPTSGEAQDMAIGDDLDAVIAAATAWNSRLLVSLRRCPSSQDPDIELDNVTGLIQVSGVETPTPSDGVVTRATGSVTVHVSAAAFAHFRIGEYTLTLEELPLDGRRLLKHSRPIMLCRSGGGLRV